MEDDNSNCLEILIRLGLFLAIVFLTIGFVSNPSLEKAKKFVEANDILNEYNKIGSPKELCRENNIISSRFYLKMKGKIYSVGAGEFWQMKISSDSIKVITTKTEFEECIKLD